LLLSKTTGTS